MMLKKISTLNYRLKRMTYRLQTTEDDLDMLEDDHLLFHFNNSRTFKWIKTVLVNLKETTNFGHLPTYLGHLP